MRVGPPCKCHVLAITISYAMIRIGMHVTELSSVGHIFYITYEGLGAPFQVFLLKELVETTPLTAPGGTRFGCCQKDRRSHPVPTERQRCVYRTRRCLTVCRFSRSSFVGSRYSPPGAIRWLIMMHYWQLTLACTGCSLAAELALERGPHCQPHTYLETRGDRVVLQELGALGFRTEEPEFGTDGQLASVQRCHHPAGSRN
jgi:hypothetical protein